MSKAWFAPKRFGYGAGLPIAWQGWAVLLGFFVGTGVVSAVPYLFLPVAAALAIGLLGTTLLVAALIGITRAKTEGGWRWRWGNEP